MVESQQVHQAILARDIIDMARDNASDADIIEYIESLCWELFMIFGEQKQNVIEWNMLHGAYNQLYIALREGEKTEELSDVDAIYSTASRIIHKYSQKNKNLLDDLK